MKKSGWFKSGTFSWDQLTARDTQRFESRPGSAVAIERAVSKGAPPTVFLWAPNLKRPNRGTWSLKPQNDGCVPFLRVRVQVARAALSLPQHESPLVAVQVTEVISSLLLVWRGPVRGTAQFVPSSNLSGTVTLLQSDVGPSNLPTLGPLLLGGQPPW